MNSSCRSLCLLAFVFASLQAPIDAFSTNSQAQSPKTIKDLSDRRDFVTQTLGGIITGAGILTSSPSPSFASSTARVQKWPGVEFLEPVYEFQLSLQALAEAAQDESKYPALKQRLEQFFKGAIINERNLYAGMALTYTNKIKYDPQELPNYIQLDLQERFNLIEDTMINLKNLKVSLPATPDAPYNKQDIVDYANGATVALKRWFELIPSDDVAKAKDLFEVSRSADANKDGKVDLEESEALSEEYRDLWKKRIEFIGA